MAATAVAVLYVLLQALYIEFYDDFGLRPEEVGLDRLAVLARAAWAGLTVIFLSVAFFVVRTQIGTQRSRQVFRPKWVALASALLLVLLLVAYRAAYVEVEALAAKVTRGQSVNGITVLGPFLDVRAHPAQVRLLNVDTRMEYIGPEEEVMFLGRGAATAAFYTEDCRTAIVPSNAVEITLLDQGPSPDEDDPQLGWDPERSCDRDRPER